MVNWVNKNKATIWVWEDKKLKWVSLGWLNQKGTTWVSPNVGWLRKAKWFVEWDVWIPWVNLFRPEWEKTPKVWDPKLRKTAWLWEAPGPVELPKAPEETEVSEKEKRKTERERIEAERERIRGLTWITAEERKKQMEALSESIRTWEFFEWPKEDFITAPDELDPEFKQVFDELSETEKKQFAAIWETARKAWQDFTKAQVEYLKKWRENKEFREERRQRDVEMDEIKWEIADIQSSARIEQARESVQNLKTNIAYLWTQGRPWISAQKLDAVADQISDAERVYRDIQKTEKLYDRARELWLEDKAASFEREMTLLQDDLDSKVNETLQNALQELDTAELQWVLDDEEKIESFRIKLLNNLDKQIEGITDANIEQRKFLIDRFDKIAAESRAFLQNKNTVNEEMSAAQWFYVDGNWNPIISATTWSRIEIPADAPMKPVFDKETGLLTTFERDPETGQIKATVQETYDEATFTEQTISDYASLVAQGKLDVNDVPANVRTNESFISALEKAPIAKVDKDRYKVAAGKVFDTQRGVFVDEDELWTTWTPKKAWGGDTIPWIGTGVITAYGSDANPYWLDIDWSIWDPLRLEEWATWVVVWVGNDPEGWGNYVMIEDQNGNVRQYAHLDQVNVSMWDTIASWQTFGTIGNTGYVEAGPWWDGSHLDLTITRPDGKKMSAEDVASYMWVKRAKEIKDTWPLGGLWVPIAFERQIKQMVPTQLMNSEVELEALNDTIQRLHAAGYSTDEAVLTYMWFDITDDRQKEQAMRFVDIARTLWTAIPEDYIPKVSNFINVWNTKKAMDLTERVAKKAISSELWAEFIPENVAKTSIQRVDQLQDLINKLEATGENPIGEFEWTFENWIGRFKSQEAQRIATQAERLIAKFRTDLIGTAWTQTENTNIDNLIPKLSDDVRNFEIKIQNMWNETLREMNNQREEYWLPSLDKDSLRDKNRRLELYKPELTPEQAQERLEQITWRQTWIPAAWIAAWIWTRDIWREWQTTNIEWFEINVDRFQWGGTLGQDEEDELNKLFQ